VPLSASLRDRAEELARVLNRSRKVRKERITRNTVIRVALEHSLDTFAPGKDECINTEADRASTCTVWTAHVRRKPLLIQFPYPH
jgi:hypothetical protein